MPTAYPVRCPASFARFAKRIEISGSSQAQARRRSGCEQDSASSRPSRAFFAQQQSCVQKAHEEKRKRIMTKFTDLGLSSGALSAIERLGYENPTPVQEQAIPHILEGRDIIAAASTGTGKTAAFLLPLLSILPRVKGRNRAPRVLVVSPTRELAQQIARTCMQISRKTGHFTTTVFGGTPYGPQIKELRGGTDILIATPGRLNDLMDRGVVDLSMINALVLDEADRMLDMGFLPAVTTIVDQTPETRQTLLFSATIDQSIQKNLGSLLKDPAVVEIARNGETAKTVEQYMMPIPNHLKPELLAAVLEEKGSDRVIVFARTKFRTEDCAEDLRRAGYSAESIHSDKSQGQRRRALDNFRRGKTSILVATDVLARGIDVPDVDHVINFDLPDMSEDYVHRIGRTGRAGEQGYAISFVTRESRRTLRDIEKLIDKEIPFMGLENYELDPTMLDKPKKGSSRRGSNAGKGKGSKRDNNQGGNRGRSDARSNKRSEGSRNERSGERREFGNRPSKRVEGEREGRDNGKYGKRNKDSQATFENKREKSDRFTSDSHDNRSNRTSGNLSKRNESAEKRAQSTRPDNNRRKEQSAPEGDFRPGRSNRKRKTAEGGFGNSSSQNGQKRSYADRKPSGKSSNYSSAAKRVSSAKPSDRQTETKPKKQRSKNKPSNYNYSKFE